MALEAGGTAQVFRTPDGDLVLVHRSDGRDQSAHVRMTARELQELAESALALEPAR